jgi:hypothetical protein
VRERHDDQLLDQARPTAVVDPDELHPARLGQIHQRDGLDNGVGAAARKGCMGRLRDMGPRDESVWIPRAVIPCGPSP